MRSRLARGGWLPPLFSLALLVAAWQIVGSLVSPVILSTPTRVVDAMLRMLASGELIRATLLTLLPLGLGLALSFVVGAGMGLLLGLSRLAASLFNVHVFIFWATPTIALLPLILVWLAIGRSMVAVIVAQLLITDTGIGFMLQFYGETLQLAKYFAPLIVTAVLAVGLTKGTDLLERRLVRWKPTAF